MMELPPMPAYVYGRECSANERLLPLGDVEAYVAQVRAAVAAAIAEERERMAAQCEKVSAFYANHRATSKTLTEFGRAVYEIAPLWATTVAEYIRLGSDNPPMDAAESIRSRSAPRTQEG